MTDHPETTQLRQQVEALSAENAALREGGFGGSKAEALLALEYDRIPDILKTPRAVRIQRKIAMTVMIIVPLVIVAVAIIGAINAYRDHERSAEMRSLNAKLEADFRQTPGKP